ncbi:MAG: diguanylate cyclase (GGDEF)-like protein [Candidatus Azotimanducaceae bacterium]|jgi:diguanylate cyclase (GGDEF)-like protein
MTLLRQLMMVVLLIFVLLFSANFVLTVLGSREYLEEQMRVHAEDAATSLGLSMTTALAQQDNTSLELLTSAVFDRGYYSNISLVDIEGTLLVSRSNPIETDDVPIWFTELINLPTPAGSSEITRGWTRLGKLTVVAHPGNAYRDLWRMTLEFLYLFSFMVILSYGILGLMVSLVMRPLRAVEAQADDICERKFAVQDSIPKTRELRRVVEAMNRMSLKIKTMFESQLQLTESLRIEARTDPITALINRREFDALVTGELVSESGPGSNVLMLLQIRNFATINQTLGHIKADALLKQIGERLKNALATRNEAIICRSSGAEFAIFIPRINLELVRRSLENAFQQVASLQQLTDSGYLDVIHMGAVFTKDSIAYSQLLTDADTALRNAQAKGTNGTYFLIHGDSENPVADLVKQAGEWHATLLDVIHKQQFLFHYQPLYQLNADGKQSLMANEIFVRIELDGDVINAGVFMPMAERFGLLVELDQLIIERALNETQLDAPPVVINLSTYSLQQDQFRSWLYQQLTVQRSKSHQVIFELQEHAVHLAYNDVRSLVQAGNSLGYRFSVDHFASSATSFAYLESLDVHFIKIDRSFVANLDQQTDNQFFVRSVAQIAHARDMWLIAEGVEREEELQILRELGVDAAMGYLLGRPGPNFSLT